MAVEFAPVEKRSFFGSFPQIGTPLGMILATGVLWALTNLLGKQAMVEWGWRIPFLFSIVLIVIGAVIRAPSRNRRYSRRCTSAARNPPRRCANLFARA